jgi:hypothetical protein
LLGKRTLPREPEPDLVMQDEEQVKAYALAGRIDGVMSAAYLFHSAQASSVIHGARRVIDLGCGPATQLAQIASLNPQSEFRRHRSFADHAGQCPRPCCGERPS